MPILILETESEMSYTLYMIMATKFSHLSPPLSLFCSLSFTLSSPNIQQVDFFSTKIEGEDGGRRALEGRVGGRGSRMCLLSFWLFRIVGTQLNDCLSFVFIDPGKWRALCIVIPSCSCGSGGGGRRVDEGHSSTLPPSHIPPSRSSHTPPPTT